MKVLEKSEKFIKALLLGAVLFSVIILASFGSLALAYNTRVSYAMTSGPGDFSNFTGLYFKTSETIQSGKVYVEYYGDSTGKVYLDMKSTTSDSEFYVYLQDLNTSNPYFVIPNNAVVGEKYEMKSVTIFSGSSTSGYEYVTSSSTNGTYLNTYGKKYITIHDDDPENEKWIGYLDSISLNDNGVKSVGDKVYINLKYYGSVLYISANFVDRTTSSIAKNMGVYLQDINTSKPYFVIPEGTTAGNYKLQDITIFNREGTIKYYSNYATGNDVIALNSTIDLQVKDKVTNTKVNLTNVSIDKTSASLNGKVGVNLTGTSKLESALLKFRNTTTNTYLNVYLEDVNGSPYFVVPATTEYGTYELVLVVLKDTAGNQTTYQNAESTNPVNFIDWDIKLTISGKTNTNELYYDNSLINDTSITEISAASDKATITINTNTSTLVSSKVFMAIKGSNKTLIINNGANSWVFNGEDILYPKDIDVSTSIIATITNLNSNVIGKGIILNYADNGILPGKALVRIKATSQLIKKLGSLVNVYYYDEDTSKLAKVAMNIRLTDDNYYEFYINHNSKYVLTNKVVDTSYTTKDDSVLVLNKSTNISSVSPLRTYIGIAAILIIVIATVLISTKVGSKKKAKD
jgi:hypothetical protein